MKRLLFILPLAVLGCVKVDANSEIVASGLLQEQGVTTYQYGTHTLGSYALRSSSVNLDLYVNQQVTIRGQKVDGYPVDGGPELIEVASIE